MNFSGNAKMENNGQTTIHNNASQHHYNGQSNITHGNTNHNNYNNSFGATTNNGPSTNTYNSGTQFNNSGPMYGPVSQSSNTTPAATPAAPNAWQGQPAHQTPPNFGGQYIPYNQPPAGYPTWPYIPGYNAPFPGMPGQQPYGFFQGQGPNGFVPPAGQQAQPQSGPSQAPQTQAAPAAQATPPVAQPDTPPAESSEEDETNADSN